MRLLKDKIFKVCLEYKGGIQANNKISKAWFPAG
jgi:hypothetical protein